MAIADWPARWEKLRQVCEKHSFLMHHWRVDDMLQGTKDHPPARVFIESPAAEDEVLAVEEMIKMPLPSDLRQIFLKYSKKIDICWMFPEERNQLPPMMNELKKFTNQEWGILNLSLEQIPALKQKFDDMQTLFTDFNEAYDKHWFDKFPVIECGFDDFIAIGVGENIFREVVFLSHDGNTDMNGRALAENLENFIDHMSLLGCPNEDFDLEAFLESGRPYLQPDGANGLAWRKGLGLTE